MTDNLCGAMNIKPVTRGGPGGPGPPVRYRLLRLLLYLITNDTTLKIARATHMPSVHSSGFIQEKPLCHKDPLSHIREERN